MKLTNELKSKIDSYFDNISADELFDVLTQKYHLPDADDIFDYGEYVSSLPWNYDAVIQNYQDIVVDSCGSVMSEKASEIYLLAA